MAEILPAQKPGEFDALNTLAEIYGFIFHKCGAELLRDVLAKGGPYREQLEAAADELAKVGLSKAAAEFAADAPAELTSCPYEPGSTNANAWITSRERKQRRKLRDA